VAYNSEDGLVWGERFMKFLNDEAHNYSAHLAREPVASPIGRAASGTRATTA